MVTNGKHTRFSYEARSGKLTVLDRDLRFQAKRDMGKSAKSLQRCAAVALLHPEAAWALFKCIVD